MNYALSQKLLFRTLHCNFEAIFIRVYSSLHSENNLDQILTTSQKSIKLVILIVLTFLIKSSYLFYWKIFLCIKNAKLNQFIQIYTPFCYLEFFYEPGFLWKSYICPLREPLCVLASATTNGGIFWVSLNRICFAFKEIFHCSLCAL